MKILHGIIGERIKQDEQRASQTEEECRIDETDCTSKVQKTESEDSIECGECDLRLHSRAQYELHMFKKHGIMLGTTLSLDYEHLPLLQKKQIRFRCDQCFVGDFGFKNLKELKYHLEKICPAKLVKDVNVGVEGEQQQQPDTAFASSKPMQSKTLQKKVENVDRVVSQDTMPQAKPIIDMVVNEARQYNRVFVSSVHPDISEQDLRSVFTAFGEVTKCQLALNAFGNGHRGFGYLEFKTAQSVHEAVEGMNGFDLGGQYLKVGRALAPPDAINYLCIDSSSGKSDENSLPAADAIAAADAEATAYITEQEILGIDKNSPGSSSPADRATASPTLPVDTQSGASQAQARPTRRCGFVATPVSPQLVQPTLGKPGETAIVVPPPAPLSTLQLMVPVLSNAAAPSAPPIQISSPSLAPGLGTAFRRSSRVPKPTPALLQFLAKD